MNIYTSLNLDPNKFNLSDTKYYVYVYLDPFTELPIYVGKGKGKRMYEHLKTNSKYKSKFKNKLISILNTGYYPIIYKIQENINAYDALNLEHFYIEFFGIKSTSSEFGTLYNSTTGGFGGDTYTHSSEEEKRKRSLNQSIKNVNRFKDINERKNMSEKIKKERKENPEKTSNSMKLRHINMKLNDTSETCYNNISNGNRVNVLAKKIYKWIHCLDNDVKLHESENFKLFFNENKNIITKNLTHIEDKNFLKYTISVYRWMNNLKKNSKLFTTNNYTDFLNKNKIILHNNFLSINNI